MEEKKTFVEKYAEGRSNLKNEYNLNPLDPRGKNNRKTFCIIILSIYLFKFMILMGEKHFAINPWIPLVSLLILFVVLIFTTMKRLRDVALSPWWSILILIPYMWIGMYLFLGFKPAKDPLCIEKYSLETLKEKIYQFTTVSFYISYLALGALQFFATWAGMFEYFHNNFIVVFFVSSFVSFIPFVGTGFGIYGAHVGWGWNLPLAVALFIGPYVIIGGLVLLAGLIDFIISNRKKVTFEKIIEQ